MRYVENFMRKRKFYFFRLDGVSNCIDDSDEQNCNAEKCGRNHRVYCPRENKCAREISYR